MFGRPALALPRTQYNQPVSRLQDRPMSTIACIVAAGSALVVADQQPRPRYDETVNVASVLIDARVLNDAGRAITGLNAADFAVTIGGTPVRVQSFSWIGGVVAQPPPAEGAAVGRGGGDGPGRLIVLL